MDTRNGKRTMPTRPPHHPSIPPDGSGRRHPAFRSARLAVAGALVLLLAACVNPREAYRQRVMDTGAPALHAVHDDRLRTLMRRMNALLLERWRTEPEIDAERRRQTQEMAGVAEALSETVDHILATLPQLSLDESEQALFRSLAGKLKTQAATLRDQAAGNYVDEIPGTLDQIEATCNACHSAFRQLPYESP